MKLLRKLLFIGLFYSCFIFLSGCGTADSSREINAPSKISKGSETIQLKMNGNDYQIDLERNTTAEELHEILPEEFAMKDLHQNEKYFELPKGLPVQAEKVGKVEIGDVLLYGNQTLVIFYQSFETSYSYTRIGRIRQQELLAEQLGSGDVVVERIQ